MRTLCTYIHIHSHNTLLYLLPSTMSSLFVFRTVYMFLHSPILMFTVDTLFSSNNPLDKTTTHTMFVHSPILMFAVDTLFSPTDPSDKTVPHIKDTIPFSGPNLPNSCSPYRFGNFRHYKPPQNRLSERACRPKTLHCHTSTPSDTLSGDTRPCFPSNGTPPSLGTLCTTNVPHLPTMNKSSLDDPRPHDCYESILQAEVYTSVDRDLSLSRVKQTFDQLLKQHETVPATPPPIVVPPGKRLPFPNHHRDDRYSWSSVDSHTGIKQKIRGLLGTPTVRLPKLVLPEDKIILVPDPDPAHRPRAIRQILRSLGMRHNYHILLLMCIIAMCPQPSTCTLMLEWPAFDCSHPGTVATELDATDTGDCVADPADYKDPTTEHASILKACTVHFPNSLPLPGSGNQDNLTLWLRLTYIRLQHCGILQDVATWT